jgi:hypothetical protein
LFFIHIAETARGRSPCRDEAARDHTLELLAQGLRITSEARRDLIRSFQRQAQLRGQRRFFGREEISQ